jgi:hypothetical protein
VIVLPGEASLGYVPVGETVALVAAPPSNSNDPGGQGEDFGKSSPLGLLVLVLFFIAVFFLVRSMTKHLKKVPANFDEPANEPVTEKKDDQQQG